LPHRARDLYVATMSAVAIDPVLGHGPARVRLVVARGSLWMHGFRRD
jgi:hypothetical protein